jgi:probable F420-dependent oxidoreductase
MDKMGWSTVLADTRSDNDGLASVPVEAARGEQYGYAGYWTSENKHDPFLPLVLAAEHTETIQLGTAVAVAFARSPMEIAHVAHDLQAFSGGRLILGLGSQVRAHIERRFSMPWSEPARRMREYVQALRAIWSSWDAGERLAFEGKFYRHTLDAPFFQPPPNLTAPQVYLAAVGPQMTRVAGEVTDGLLLHAFTTADYLTKVTLPLLHEGVAAAGRDISDVAVAHLCLIATGATDQDLHTAVQVVRARIAFYGSTPSYRPVLELHGWGALSDELHALSRRRDDAASLQMTRLIDDDVLAAFAVVATPGRVASALVQRFGGLVDRVSFYTPYAIDPELLADIAQAIAEHTVPDENGHSRDHLG